MQELLTTIGDWLVTQGSRILTIVLITAAVVIVARVMLRRFTRLYERRHPDWESKKRAETLGLLLKTVFTVAIAATAIVMILSELNMKIGPLLAAAGVVGIAIGFGAQHLVNDLIRGFFIMIDNEIRVGDIVEVAGKSGTVERLNLRLTVLRDVSGNVHFIPNGNIDVITNMTKEFSRYTLDIAVAYHEDVDEVMDILRQIDEEVRGDPEFAQMILEPIEIMGLERFDDSAMIIRARFKTEPIKQWKVKRQFNRLLKKAFDANGIKFPYPHVTVYMGQDKQGSAPPLYVKAESTRFPSESEA